MTDTTESGVLATKNSQLDKAQKKAEAAAAEAQRLQIELRLARDGFTGRYLNAQIANDDLHECETSIARLKNTLPKVPPADCDMVQFLADLPPQKLGEFASKHCHQTIPGIEILEKVRTVLLGRFEEAADAVESYAAETGIAPALVVQFTTWRKLAPEQRANPNLRPNFKL
jgi:hypothetical protein